MARSPTAYEFRQIYSTLSYQFGPQLGERIQELKDKLRVTISGATKKIRYVHLGKQQLFAMNPLVGLFSPSVLGARLIHESSPGLQNRVQMNEEASPFIRKGKSAFCKHVLALDMSKAPKSEVILVDPNDELLGTGTLLLPPSLVLQVKSGVAVRVRRGVEQ